MSILDQNYPRTEVIVVNDAGHAVAPWVKANMPRWVRVLEAPRRLGVLGATTLGWRRSTGALVAKVDDDDWLASGALFTVALAADRNPGVGWFYGGWECRQDTRFGPSTGKVESIPFSRERILREHMISCAVYYRREVMARMGGWSGPPSGMLEDWWMPILASSVADGYYIPEVLYHVRIHSGRMSLVDAEARLREAKEWIQDRIVQGVLPEPRRAFLG